MAIQNVKDQFIFVQSAGDTYVGNQKDQTYVLVADLLQAGEVITIVDEGGINRIALPPGLTITESLVAQNEIQLKLNTGAVVNIRSADNFTYALAETITPYEAGAEIDFSTFVQDVLSTDVPVSGVATGGGATVNADGSVDTVPPVSGPAPVPDDDHADTFDGATNWSGIDILAEIEEIGDRDFFKVNLNSGFEYIFNMTSIDGLGLGLDSYLYLYDESGSQVAYDDDSGGGLDAELVFIPDSSGEYYLEASAFADGSVGRYLLSQVEEPSVDPSPAPGTGGFSYYLDYTNAYSMGEYRDQIDESIRAALDYWGQFIDSHSDSNIHIEVNYDPQPGSGLASAGSIYIPSGDYYNNKPVYVSGVQHELMTGEDVNYGSAEAIINIASQDLSSNNWWYDPTPMDRTDNMPGRGQLDFMGVMLHEFAHALGFTSTYDFGYYSGFDHNASYYSVYDTFVGWDSSESDFYFTGSEASEAYNQLGGYGSIPLYVAANEPGSSFSHYDGVSDSGDLNNLGDLLMNPRVEAGNVLDVSALDLAILSDLGYEIVNQNYALPSNMAESVSSYFTDVVDDNQWLI